MLSLGQWQIQRSGLFWSARLLARESQLSSLLGWIETTAVRGSKLTLPTPTRPGSGAIWSPHLVGLFLLWRPEPAQQYPALGLMRARLWR